MDFQEFAKFALLGLAAGASYAIAAQGLVLIYRGSGVLNFAQGAMALLGAALYVELRDDHGWATGAAIAAALLVTGLIGVLVHLLVMRPLRRASPLARLVATLGVLGVVQSVAVLRYGSDFRFVTTFLPSDTVEPLSGVLISQDRFWLFGIAVALTAMLWAVYRFTPFGRSTTAVAENERSAASLGISPNVVAGLNWGFGGMLAAAAGILVLPITGLNPASLTLLILPALAAAMVGGFSSFPLTLVGGVLLGVAQSEITSYQSDLPGWFPESGLADSLPFLVIIGVLVLRGRALPLRGYLVERLPTVGRPRHPAAGTVLGLALGVLLIFSVSTDNVSSLTTSLITAIVCLSVVVVTGLAGQISLGQYAFAGIGALASARLAATQDVSFPFALLFAVAVAVPVGLVFALPALRTRGVNLAIATLGLALVVEKLVVGNRDYTGGYEGTTVDTPTLFGWDVYSVTHPERYALVALGLFAVFAVFVANVRRGRVGRRLLATRANERAAASLGISVVGSKLYAFAFGAGIASSAGVLLAFRYPSVRFTQFDVFRSINVVVLTFIGGVGYISGALIGGAMVVGGLITEVLESILDLNEYGMLVTSALLIVVIIRDPNGITHRLQLLVAAVRVRVVERWQQRQPRPAEEELSGPPLGRCEPHTLSIRNLTVRFGGVVALDDVSLDVGPGEIVGLIGPNGAGKTTLVDATTGFSRASAGAITIDEHPLRARSPRARARAGIGRTFQNLELFEDMTVADNLRAACDGREAIAYLTDLVHPGKSPLTPAALEAVRAFELGADLDRRPGELSFGKRRLLAIARAVAARPSMLLLDEPAAGLDEDETAELGVLLRHLADNWGIAILLIEHDMGLVMRVSDRIVVLDFGRLLAEGTPDAIRNDQRVIAAYLGSHESGGVPAAPLVSSGPGHQP